MEQNWDWIVRADRWRDAAGVKKERHQIRCCECGKFMRVTKRSESLFFPDNEFGEEIIEWICQQCHDKALAQQRRYEDGPYER